MAGSSPVPNRSNGLRLATDSAPYGLADAALGVVARCAAPGLVTVLAERGPGEVDVPAEACRADPAEAVVLPDAPAPVSASATAGSAASAPPIPKAMANAPMRPT
ncbi:hypothetical protein B1R94_04560 [Mycolicibacterium litorale]|nr:hypothetical protein B1R94_04560 [Mycolicibacterium litorale]